MTPELACPSVVLPQGEVVGVKLENEFAQSLDAFLGIPYAQPPVGDLRFRPAVKVPESNETIDASKYGPTAPGKALLAGPELKQSEECLTVNVFRPSKSQSDADKLPVAIYTHGGAFNRGSAVMHKTASMVAWSQEPFVAVSFGYRIGALGFLPSTVTKKEGLLNLGLRDQVALFEWVQESIAQFGGDPGNVTLFGHHLLNYGEGKALLFHRVILESGSPTSRAVRPYDAEVHEQQFRDLLQEVGCPPNLPESEIFPYLRSLPSSVITNAQTVVFDKYNPSLRWAFQPVIDGDTIPRKPLDAWTSGQWHKVPIMTGFNSNEGTMYVNKEMADPAHTDQTSPYVESRTGYALGPQYKRIEAAYGHYVYVAPVRQTAHFAATVVGRANHGDNMYYETHNTDITGISESQKELPGTLHAYITSFITHGDPNAVPGRYAQRPEWKPYNPDSPRILIFGEGNEELIGGGVAPPAKFVADEWAKEETAFWWEKVPISQLA
ncbi:hypothetical protein BDV12DRAFT_209556 [Aspergillus spectabilis]